ncbi:threonine/serine exporter ThrE [Corynebacterium bouchesdurhonense]|uniref:threonine/serine exporter ThrE n=1 Tax=Corynebacterium bouchesdurhonense TaxID=1720192 RepID=UPI00082D3D9A|nr:threonine/serine exporter family protein [Corynebacterium bouchesdurhonense]
MKRSLRDRLRGSGQRVATIDAARTSPPPSVLAPVDLTDPTQVAAVMMIAARIGEILIANGTTSSDAIAQIRTVTSSYGLHYCHVDITVNTITMNAVIGGEDRTPVTVFRVVTRISENYHKLQEADRLIRSIRAGATRPELAEKILDDIDRSPIPWRNTRFLAGYTVMGAAVAILLGGDWLMAVVGGITAFLIMGFNKVLSRNDLPYFFHCVLGGFVATIPAAVFYDFSASIGHTIVPSQVIASGIVVLLAGLTLVQSLLDGITGSPVTASARFFNTLLNTGGIIAGVAMGLYVSNLLGVGLPPIETMPGKPSLDGVGFRIFGSATAAAAFAVACFAEEAAILVSFVTAAAGSTIYYVFLIPFGTDRFMATAACATVVGLAGGLIARRFLISPVITAVAGVTPFLPGSGIYRGMYAVLNEQMVVGMNNIFSAIAVCMALAGGVVFGEWVARRLRAPQHYLPYRAFKRVGRVTFQQIQRALR